MGSGMKRKLVFASVAALGLITLLVLLASVALRTPLLREWHRWRRTVDSDGVPMWLRYHRFEHPAFDFFRLRYASSGRGTAWATDYPAADVNLSERLRRSTSLEVGEPKVVSFTELDVEKHRFTYVSANGQFQLSEEEAGALRTYLLAGGFLMVDDFWGGAEWDNFKAEISKAFPEREPSELPLEHPIFHCVFDLKEKPQVCSISIALAGRSEGITWERVDAKGAHYWAILDDARRVMVVACHNTDLADGWERIDVDDFYYREFSQKKAFPMAFNIIYYALTHGRP